VSSTLDHATAAVAAAREAGLEVDRGEVVRVAANVLVRLTGPGGRSFAARLAGATEPFRDTAVTLGREARLAAALADVGAPVAAPLAGPCEAGGRVVTLWPWLEVRSAGDAAQAGRALRACHDALAGLDPGSFDLVDLAMLTEARTLADEAAGTARAVLVPAIERALTDLQATSRRPVHGDSHPGNVLWTADGPLWSDWEDAHLAPLEWDLACLVTAGRVRGDDFGWSDAALHAHGGAYHPDRLEACVHARVAQGTAYLAATGRGGDALLRERLEWLRARHCAAYVLPCNSHPAQSG
jgi:aminoglycoside phosphotransferase (APT) family kinase protein